MKKQLKAIITIALLLINTYTVFSQCATASNIYTFIYNYTTYDVIKENKSWAAACACAVQRGGMLAEINDAAENTAIFNKIKSNAGIIANNTISAGGGRGPYIWIGGNDIATEGNWVWDGDNDTSGTPFWKEAAIGNLYNNWGGKFF